MYLHTGTFRKSDVLMNREINPLSHAFFSTLATVGGDA
jgi:hypothetical protein